jgi:hypothetical protein
MGDLAPTSVFARGARGLGGWPSGQDGRRRSGQERAGTPLPLRLAAAEAEYSDAANGTGGQRGRRPLWRGVGCPRQPGLGRGRAEDRQ